MIRVENLTKSFHSRAGVFGKTREVKVLHGVSCEIARGEALGLVGESGSGKSTLGRCLLRLIEPTGGRVFVDGTELTALSQAELVPWRRRLQIIFQDPYTSLNPKLSIGETLREPLRVHRLCEGRAGELKKVEELLGK